MDHFRGIQEGNGMSHFNDFLYCLVLRYDIPCCGRVIEEILRTFSFRSYPLIESTVS